MEVGVTMYVLSISSVSEVLMVQFEFSNSHTELTSTAVRSFLSDPSSSSFVRVPARVPTHPPALNFFFHTVHRGTRLFSPRDRSRRRTPSSRARTDRSIVRSFLLGRKSNQDRSIVSSPCPVPNTSSERISFSSAPFIQLCRLFPIVCFAIIRSTCVCACVQTFSPKYSYARVPREIQRKNNTEQRETD